MMIRITRILHGKHVFSFSRQVSCTASFLSTMPQYTDFDKYQLAIDRLNVLQNVPAIKVTDSNELIKYRLIHTINMCKKLNISEDDIDALNVIHITGTKGKGSTCAFIESILRNFGYRTGLFSSPHLIEVKERIKINGSSLSYSKFYEYLNFTLDELISKWNENDGFAKPTYFQVLTCAMFLAFVKEKVDVAIVEVGIGGQYDYTNIIRNPIACGISSLGLDHCSILGNTLEEIAWQKAGIIKPSCVAFTIEHDSKSAFDVIVKRSVEAKAPLCLVPTVSEFLDHNSNSIKLGINGKIQYLNSSLALQIAKFWMDFKNSTNLFDRFEWIKQNCQQVSNELSILKPMSCLDNSFIKGLSECRWPGRNQVIHSKNQKVTYYLDGAHTAESIEQFIEWFLEMKRGEKSGRREEKNVLLFNYTGERDSSKFLSILMKVKYDAVAFSRLEAYPANFSNAHDNVRNMPNTVLDTDSKYQNLLNGFLSLHHDKFASTEESERPPPECKVFGNILDSLGWLTNLQDDLLANQLKHSKSAAILDEVKLNNTTTNIPTTDPQTEPPKINVLITGSLYLVGLSLKVLNYKID